jgi:copper homeostasis protein
MEINMTDGSALVLEACVEDLDAALAAERGGAHRIELCSALDQDGLTPSRELTRECVRRLSVPVMAMVRPRGGDFVYSAAEIAQMESEIEWFRRSGVAGVVFGLLTGEGRIDLVNTRRLVAAAQPLQVTFHKAIDASRDVLESLHELNSVAGLTRVLTSGGSDTAWNGRDVLRAMNDLADRRLTLIAAGRVLPENRVQIADYTGIRELHGRRIVG